MVRGAILRSAMCGMAAQAWQLKLQTPKLADYDKSKQHHFLVL
jgi:hypothetical protein